MKGILYISKYKIKALFRFRNTFKNYISILTNRRKLNYPIYVKLRKGETKVAFNQWQLYCYSIGMDVIYDPYSKRTRIEHTGKHLEFLGAENDGDLPAVFFYEEFRDVSVANKVVIDVGASIGDSSVYFAIHGASQVIAIEPFIESYRNLKLNIQLNGLCDKILPLNVGVTGTDGSLVTKIYSGSVGNQLVGMESDEGEIEVEVVSVPTLINKFGLNQAVLKMDCEGCEYDAILNCPEEMLHHFDEIAMEYHFGNEKLVDKLKNCGFEVKVTQARTEFNTTSKTIMKVGFIFASRKYVHTQENAIDRGFISI